MKSVSTNLNLGKGLFVMCIKLAAAAVVREHEVQNLFRCKDDGLSSFPQLGFPKTRDYLSGSENVCHLIAKSRSPTIGRPEK